MRPVRCQAAKHRFCPFGGLSRTPGSSASLRSGCPSPGSSRSSFFIREAEPRGCLLPHSSPLVFCWLNFWLCLRMQGFPDQGPASPGSDKAESCSARAPGTPPAPPPSLNGCGAVSTLSRAHSGGSAHPTPKCGPLSSYRQSRSPLVTSSGACIKTQQIEA